MMRRPLVLAGSLLAVLLAIPAIAMASGNDGNSDSQGADQPAVHNLVKFDVMAPVTGPYVGAANPIRGLAGGGLPWEIREAKGQVNTDGTFVVEVRGLVLAHEAPVPPAQQGTNPVGQVKTIVSCQTINAGAPAVTNVVSAPAPVTTTGNATMVGKVSLPSPCIAPIVFVTSPANAWFSATGA